MVELLSKILLEYNYVCDDKLLVENLHFYKHADSNIASYFLLHNIDCTEIEKQNDKMKEALEKLEYDYTRTELVERKPIKLLIQELFSTIKEAGQLDKNTSAIFLLKFSDMHNLNLHRNLIYAVEESPNFFKRYILPYTQQQIDELNKTIADYESRKVHEILSDIANDEDEYYKLMENKNIGSVYELVIRLFAKVPFLQYRFSAGTMPKPIEDDVSDKAEENNLADYHRAG